MLLQNPKEFDRVAREWCVVYANGPRKHVGESSGGATAESIKRDAKLAKAAEQREELAA